MTILPVVISNFTADNEAINAGDTVTLSWTSENATACSVNSGADLGATDSTTDTPASDETYTLTCTGPSGSATADVSIQVSSIDSFEADRVLLLEGESVTFNWQTTHASDCTLGGNAQTDDGDTTEQPSVGEHAYTLSCTGAGGRTLEQTIDVLVVLEPILTLESEVVSQGETVNATVSNDESWSCTLSGTGEMVETHNVQVSCSVVFGGEELQANLSKTVYLKVEISNVRVEVVDISNIIGPPRLFFDTVGSVGCKVNGTPFTSGAEIPDSNANGAVSYSLTCEGALPGGADVTTPADFAVWWGNLTEGDLAAFADSGATVVTGIVDLANSSVDGLSGLNKLEQVSGKFELTGNGTIAGLNLSNLQKVGGNFSVTGNNQLGSVTLGALTDVLGNFSVTGNSNLLGVDAPALTDVIGDFTVTNNNKSGFSLTMSELASVGGAFTVSTNGNLGTLSLPALASVEGALTVSTNGNLANLTMDALESVGGDFTVKSNANLTTLSMASLITVGGSFQISGNGALCNDRATELANQLQGFAGTTIIVDNNGNCT